MRLSIAGASAALLLTLVTVGPVFGQGRPAVQIGVSPQSAVAATRAALSFVVTAVESQDGVVEIALPNGWQAPPLATVTVNRGTCNSASLTTGTAGTLRAAFKCSKGRTFTIGYSSVVPTAAATYRFATAASAGRTLAPVASSPSFDVMAGPAADLRLESLSGVIAGTAQTTTVRAVDQYGNTAPTYRGTVRFASGDLQADLPGPYTFSAGDAGRRTFPVTLKTAGAQTVTVSDPDSRNVSFDFEDAQSAAVTPAPTSRFAVWIAPSIDAFRLITTFNCNYRPADAYGNLTTDYAGAVTWSSSDAAAVLPVSGPYNPLQQPFCQMRTAGSQQVTVTDQANPEIRGSATTMVNPPPARGDAVIITDPTHFGGVTAHALDPLENDGWPNFSASQLRLVRVSQATFTDENGVTRQLGQTYVNAGGGSLTLDLFPPADLDPEVEGMQIWRCSPDGQGGVCLIGVPISITYEATDSVNRVSATVTVTLNTPEFYLFPFNAIAPAPVYPLIGPGGAYVEGGNVFFPIDITTTLSNRRDNPSGTVTFRLTTPGPCAADRTRTCTISGDMELILPPLPGNFNPVGLSTNLSGAIESPLNRFASVRYMGRVSSGDVTLDPIGILAGVASLTGVTNDGRDAFLGGRPSTVPDVLRRSATEARALLLAAGLQPVDQCRPSATSIVTSQSPAAPTAVPIPTIPWPFPVTLGYSSCQP